MIIRRNNVTFSDDTFISIIERETVPVGFGGENGYEQDKMISFADGIIDYKFVLEGMLKSP